MNEWESNERWKDQSTPSFLLVNRLMFGGESPQSFSSVSEMFPTRSFVSNHHSLYSSHSHKRFKTRWFLESEFGFWLVPQINPTVTLFLCTKKQSQLVNSYSIFQLGALSYICKRVSWNCARSDGISRLSRPFVYKGLLTGSPWGPLSPVLPGKPALPCGHKVIMIVIISNVTKCIICRKIIVMVSDTNRLLLVNKQILLQFHKLESL